MENRQTKKTGFTLVELIMVITLFGIIFGGSGMVFARLLGDNALMNRGFLTVQGLREARSNAVAQRNDNAWGMYLNTTADPDEWVLFSGSSYAARNTAFDQLVPMNTSVSFSNITLGGGGQEIIFSKQNGTTSNNGSFELTVENETFQIQVNALGLADYTLP